MSPRPKLSDALSRVAFSPKRPPRRAASPMVQAPPAKSRSVSSRQQHTVKSSSTRPRTVHVESEDEEDKAPTPRSRTRASQSQSFAGQSLSYAQPEVNIMPPTPTSPNYESKFVKMAGELEREIELEQKRDINGRDIPAVAQSTVRERKSTKNAKVPLKSAMAEVQEIHAPAPKNPILRTPYRNGKLYLPDVTGITSAVGYDAKDDREIDGK
jgi:hypothetical protein